MAQHCEIGTAGFDIVFKDIDPEQYRDYPRYKRIPFKGIGHIYLCEPWDCGGGGGLKSTEFVLCYTPKKGDYTYEIHFNYRNKILEVYLVA